jgi:hypothetical protein
MKAIGVLVSFGLFASTGRVITFDSEALGKTPPGWIVAMTNRGAPPKWEIRLDRTAATQPYVMAQVSDEPGADRAPLAILDSPTLRDGDVSVRIKPVGGHEDQGGGLVWRYRDANNYYLVTAGALSGRLSVFKVMNGKRIPISRGVKYDFPLNDWSILKVSARGTSFQVYVDHRRAIQGTDDTFPGPGRVGLCTAADSVTYFDDFRVYPK